MDNGFDGTANVAEQLANLLLPAGYALFGKVDLRIVCEEIQEASPIGGNPALPKAFRYSSATDFRCSFVIVCLVSAIAVSPRVLS